MVALDALETHPAAANPSDPPASRRYLVFAIVSIALLMASVDQTIVATALHTLQSDLHAQVNWSSWTITIYALGQILAMPLAGSISDQFGRKKVFLAAVLLFTISSLLCGLATNIYELVALRGVQAIGGGAFLPSATGIVSDLFGKDRDRAIGLFSSIFPIGGIIGPILGGVFVTYWSWRGIFLVNVPLGVILLVLGLAYLPNSRPTTNRRLDAAGIALLGLGILSLMFAISSVGSASDERLALTAGLPFVLGAGLLTAFVRHAGRAASPFVPLELLRGPGFAIVNVINFLFGVAALGFGALVPIYAQERYGISTLGAGTLLTARAVGMIAVAALAVFALRRTGYRKPMMIGFGVTGIGMFLLGTAAHSLSPYAWLAMAAAVIGIGLGISQPSSNNASLQLAPENTAAVTGLRGMFRQMGGITGVSVVTVIIARSSDPAIAQAHAFYVFGAIMLLVVPLVHLVPDHRGRW